MSHYFGSASISSMGGVDGLIPDSGTSPVTPDVSGDITITGGTTGLTFVGSSSTVTLSGTLIVANGGTGATSLTDHGVLVGSGTDPITAITVGTDGQVLLGATGADPAMATLTSSDGSIVFSTGANSLDLTVDTSAAGGIDAIIPDSGTSPVVPDGSGDITLTGGTTGLTFVGGTNTVTVQGTLIVANGGTGATSLTDHGVLVGSGTNPITALSVGTNGQLLIGATGADPAMATLTSSDGSVVFATGANSLDLTVSPANTLLPVTALDDTDSDYTVLSTDVYLSCDVSGGILTIDFPNAPSTGRVYYVKDSGGDAATNNITLTTAGGVVEIDGATTFVMNTDYESVNLLFNGTSYELF